MRNDAFDRLVTELEGLTAEQRQQVLDRLKRLGEGDDSGRLIAERLGDQVACVHCGHTEIQRFGQARSGPPRYRCKGCQKTFMALTGTPFLRLRDKAKRLAYASCRSDGMTIRATAKTTDLSVDRAFRWRHRFLAFLSQHHPSGLTGVAAADETFFRRSCKGQRKGLPRKAKQRGGPAPEGSEGERVGGLVAMPRGAAHQ